MHIWWIVLPKSIIYPLTKNKMWRLNLPFLKSKRASVNAIISWSSEIYPDTLQSYRKYLFPVWLSYIGTPQDYNYCHPVFRGHTLGSLVWKEETNICMSL